MRWQSLLFILFILLSLSLVHAKDSTVIDEMLQGLPIGTRSILGYFYADCYNSDKASFYALIAILLVFGFPIAFFGLKLISIIIFFCMFFCGCVIAFLIFYFTHVEFPLWLIFVICAIFGFVLGGISLLHIYISLFLKGFSGGFMAVYISMRWLSPFVVIPAWLQLVLLGAFGLICGIATASSNSPLTLLVGTAGLGAHMLTYGCYFITKPPLSHNGEYIIPTYASIGVTILATIIQYCYTAKDMIKLDDTYDINKENFQRVHTPVQHFP